MNQLLYFLSGQIVFLKLSSLDSVSGRMGLTAHLEGILVELSSKGRPVHLHASVRGLLPPLLGADGSPQPV